MIITAREAAEAISDGINWLAFLTHSPTAADVVSNRAAIQKAFTDMAAAIDALPGRIWASRPIDPGISADVRDLAAQIREWTPGEVPDEWAATATRVLAAFGVERARKELGTKRMVLISVPFALVIAVVIRACHGFNGLAIWNSLPVILAWIVLLAGLRSRRPIAIGAATYAILSLAFTASGVTDTSTSTAALGLLFGPVATVVLAAPLAFLAWTIADRLNEPPRS